MRKIGYLFALYCLGFAGLACDNQDRIPTQTAPSAKEQCRPAFTYACTANCATGSQAWKICNDTGDGFGTCQCVAVTGSPDAGASIDAPTTTVTVPDASPASTSTQTATLSRTQSNTDITITVVLPPAPKPGCQQGQGFLPDGSTRSCGNDQGACRPGTQTCSAGLWSDCSGGTGPHQEVCDGVDNDCDGKTDNGIICQCDPDKDSYRDCGSNVGMCKYGRQYCVAISGGYQWGETCANDVGPRSEHCDDLDWDCDDVAHNGFNLQPDPSNCGACGVSCARSGAVGTCVAGKCEYACLTGYYDLDKDSTNGCEYLCPYTKPLAAELCNGLDDNCNGQVDEGCNFDTDPNNCGKPGRRCQFANAVSTCEDGDCRLGACAMGFVDLDKDPWNGCEYSCTKTSSTEVCGNKNDDNCNGEVDEGCACDPNDASAVLCLASGNPHSNTGICKASAICQANGQLAACQVKQGPLARECNDDGLDRDCDGIVDFKQYDLQSDVGNCGKCGNVCSFPNAAALCVAGACQMGTCAPGWNDTDKNTKNGCEYPCFPTNNGVEQCDGIDNDCNGAIDDGPSVCACTLVGSTRPCGPPDVGECRSGKQTCKAPGQWDTCDLTKAVFPVPEICNGKDDDCDGVADSGINTQTDPNNCGACNVKCAAANGTASCIAGHCAIASCNKYYQNLDNDPGNGCEFFCVPEGAEVCDGRDNDCNGKIDDGIGSCGCTVGSTQTCGKNVGACHAGNQTCVGPAPGSWGPCNNAITGTPEICNNIDDDCNGTADDGFNLQTDVNNCGSCGNACHFANATAACVKGVCQLLACESNWYDINRSSVDGCEVPCVVTNGGVEQCDKIDNNCDGRVDENFDLNSNLLNCGACGHACNLPNATAVCTAGVCEISSCKPGYWDLDEDPNDGCEHACTPTNGGVEICDGLDNDCNGTPDDGIFCNCTSAQSPRECGTGIGMCQTGLQTCVSGVWQTCTGMVDPRPIICDANTDMNCNGIPDAVEWNTKNDKSNCGGCGIVCSFSHAGASCVNGVCTMGSCDAGYYDLDGKSSTGCEYGMCVNTRNGVEYCDGIDNNCDGIVDNVGAPLLTDPMNCGACGNICALPNTAVNGCSGGGCTVIHCLPGFADTNGLAADGCETKLALPDSGVGGAGGADAGGAGGANGGSDGGVLSDAGDVFVGTINCVATSDNTATITITGAFRLGTVVGDQFPSGLAITQIDLGQNNPFCWETAQNPVPPLCNAVPYLGEGVPLTIVSVLRANEFTPRIRTNGNPSFEYFNLKRWEPQGICHWRGCGPNDSDCVMVLP